LRETVKKEDRSTSAVPLLWGGQRWHFPDAAKWWGYLVWQTVNRNLRS